MPVLSVEDIIRPPATFDEAVTLLLSLLTDREKEAIVSVPKDQLIDLHFSIGLFIRNALQLHDRTNPLTALGDADDLSMDLLNALWERLSH